MRIIKSRLFFIAWVSVLATILAVALSATCQHSARAADDAPWKLLGQPDGADIRVLAVDPTNPDRVYASNGESIFRTDDGGVSWSTPLSDVYARESIIVHPLDSHYVYADHQFASSDYGQSWRKIGGLWVDFAHSGTLLSSGYTADSWTRHRAPTSRRFQSDRYVVRTKRPTQIGHCGDTNPDRGISCVVERQND